jgi:hypothetical protein
MAAERDLELLDDYLANRLDPQGKAAFEQKLQTDPTLHSEFQLQQQFISGIKKARIAELKSIMNNVPIPAAQGGTAVAGKIALWTIVAGVVAAGLYLYLNQNPREPKQNTTEIKVEEQNKNPEVLKPGQHEDSPVVSETPASSEQKPLKSPKAPQKRNESQHTKNRKIEVYDPTEEAKQSESTQSSETTVPNQYQHPDITVEIESNNKKYNFNYQFKDGRLLLYGPFEKNLYDIMEFFSDDKRTLFLYYNDSYYLLKEDSNKLKPLNAITDPALIKKLKDYRK